MGQAGPSAAQLLHPEARGVSLALSQSGAIACSEVWGGNRVAQAALVLPGLQGWVFSRPHQGAVAGGDLHYVSSCGTGRITRVLLADVAGHGDAVAPLADRLRRLMHRYMNHIDPRKLANALNQDLARAGEAGQFVTAVVVTFFSPTGQMTVCNAGHPRPAIYRAAQRRWSLIDQPDNGQGGITNLPLGVLEESGYTGREVVLEPGDIVLLYSDCLIEARGAGTKLLAQQGLLEVLNSLEPPEAMGGPSAVVDHLLAAIGSRGYALDDDMTAVVLRCVERSGGAPLGQFMRGMWRSFVKLWGPDGPWPEWSKANILGPYSRRFYRDARKQP